MCSCHSEKQAPNVGGSDLEELLELPIGIVPDRKGRFVCVDKCIAETIRWLWFNNIQTLGCCCGHNEDPPSVVVESGYTLDDAENIRSLIAEVDDRTWIIYKWQLTPAMDWSN